MTSVKEIRSSALTCSYYSTVLLCNKHYKLVLSVFYNGIRIFKHRIKVVLHDMHVYYNNCMLRNFGIAAHRRLS